MKRILLKQEKGNIIHYVDHTTESFTLKGDAMITTEQDLVLMVYGADCSIIVFWDDQKIGACHAGWQGYSGGIIKAMAQQFQGGYCYLGPFMHHFEIKRDECFDRVTKYAGEKFLHFGDIITFDFRSAVMSELSGVISFIDPRNTFTDETLGSNRRGYSDQHINTQNRISIWKHNNQVYYKFFKPSEVSQDFFDQWKSFHH